MDGSRDCRLTISHVATHMTERGDHDFCHSRSHNTDTDPTSREQPATAELYLGPHPRKSHALSTELPPPPAEFLETPKKKKWCGGTRLPTQQSIVNHDDGSATKKKYIPSWRVSLASSHLFTTLATSFPAISINRDLNVFE